MGARISLTMLEQALANVMNLGLNCRQVTGPVCLPSSNATFKPLSAFHTWIFPSSEPVHTITENKQKKDWAICAPDFKPLYPYGNDTCTCEAQYFLHNETESKNKSSMACHTVVGTCIMQRKKYVYITLIIINLTSTVWHKKACHELDLPIIINWESGVNDASNATPLLLL